MHSRQQSTTHLDGVDPGVANDDRLEIQRNVTRLLLLILLHDVVGKGGRVASCLGVSEAVVPSESGTHHRSCEECELWGYSECTATSLTTRRR